MRPTNVDISLFHDDHGAVDLIGDPVDLFPTSERVSSKIRAKRNQGGAGSSGCASTHTGKPSENISSPVIKSE